MQRNSVLLVVDVQNDFCPGGALGVPEADQIVPRVNDYVRLFRERDRPIIATRDWHPRHTTHFREQGGPWPPHCIQGTWGAEFHPDLVLPEGITIISKGMGAAEDAYSAFQARDEQGRHLRDILQELGIAHVYIAGLTLDYCVRTSCLDAREVGLPATVLIDGTRAVNVQPHDAELAIEELVHAGVGLAVLETIDA